MHKPKVLISTDIGSDIDDAMSILTMMNSGINVEAIYVVNGDVKSRAYIEKHMVNLAGKSIDVVTGDAMPLGPVTPYSFFEDCYVDDSFIDKEKTEAEYDIRYKSLEEIGVKTNGIEDLTERLSKGKYSIFSLAPMTLIARLISEHPKEARNIEHLYLMACRFDEKTLEHNIYHDLSAAHVVFASDIPITVIPADTCDRYKMPNKFLQNLASPAGRYVRKMALGFNAARTARGINRNNTMEIIKREVFLEYRKSPGTDPEEFIKELKKAKFLAANIDDPAYGAFEDEKYFDELHALISHFRNPLFDYKRGENVAEALEAQIPTSFSVSDVYVPYCFLNQNKIIVNKGTIGIVGNGESVVMDGEKHRIVTGINYSDFERYLAENLI